MKIFHPIFFTVGVVWYLRIISGVEWVDRFSRRNREYFISVAVGAAIIFSAWVYTRNHEKVRQMAWYQVIIDIYGMVALGFSSSALFDALLFVTLHPSRW